MPFNYSPLFPTYHYSNVVISRRQKDYISLSIAFYLVSFLKLSLKSFITDSVKSRTVNDNLSTTCTVTDSISYGRLT